MLLRAFHHLVLSEEAVGHLVLHDGQQWPDHHGGHELHPWNAKVRARKNTEERRLRKTIMVGANNVLACLLMRRNGRANSAEADQDDCGHTYAYMMRMQ